MSSSISPRETRVHTIFLSTIHAQTASKTRHMAQIILKQNFLVYIKTSNKIICSNLQIKFHDFSLTLNRDLEIPWYKNSMTIPCP